MSRERRRPAYLAFSGAVVLILVLGVIGCGKNLLNVFFHPSVEQRVSDSLGASFSAPAPSPIPVSDPNHFKFAVFSDVHMGASDTTLLPRFAQDVGPNGIDFFVVLGDLTEDGSTDQLHKVKAALDGVGIPYYVTIGNHDLFQNPSSGGWGTWKSTFGPGTYSVTIAGAVRFIFLDTASGDIGPTQFKWLQEQFQGGSVPFNLVGTHYPIYDGITPFMWRLSSVQERYKLTYLLDQLGVYAYIGGHIHGFRQVQVSSVAHFIVGSMYPSELDIAGHGYLLFSYSNGQMTWEQKRFSDVP